jgi:hypothetical protein
LLVGSPTAEGAGRYRTDTAAAARDIGGLETRKEKFVKTVSYLQEKEFLCGLFAQLEQAWVAAQEPEAKTRIFKLAEVVMREGRKLHHQRVHAWIDLVADTLGGSHWKHNLPARPRLPLARRRDEYTLMSPCEKPRTRCERTCSKKLGSAASKVGCSTPTPECEKTRTMASHSRLSGFRATNYRWSSGSVTSASPS